jgi:hypothetical protein
MDISQPSYEYASLTPANSIRILILLPASAYSASLQVRLIHTHGPKALGQYDDLYQTPYEAISYTWGEPIFSHNLECEGKIIKVTATVDNLLRRLRKPATSRSLWLDSVCINQGDSEEKNVQVQMMGQIYSRALKVHVWLGEAEPHDRVEWVFNFFREMAVSSHDDNEILALRNPWEKDVDKTVDNFLARLWFGRRWILQEVVLAFDITVRCGQFKMPWKWLARGSEMLNSYSPAQGFLSPTSTHSLETIASLNTPSNQLLNMIFDLHMSDCSDPRDRIFALYGMATGLKDLPVNYGIPWTDVYIGFSGVCMKAGHFLTLLQHVTAFGSLSEGNSLPSWVPDWNNARSSARRFSLSDPEQLSQNCELVFEAPQKVHIGDEVSRLSRIVGRPDQQSGSEQQSHMANATSYRRHSASHTIYLDISMLFSLCRQNRTTQIAFSPRRLLAQILSVAIMDMRLCFNTRNAVVEFMREMEFMGELSGVDVADFDKFNLTPEDRLYGKFLKIIERIIENAIPDSDHTLERWAEAEPPENLQYQTIVRVAELLKHHSLFYTRAMSLGGSRMKIPGITSCLIEDGDYVLKPQSKEGDIKPAVTAFLSRPISKKPLQLRIVGLCFIAEFKDLSGIRESIARARKSFTIV